MGVLGLGSAPRKWHGHGIRHVGKDPKQVREGSSSLGKEQAGQRRENIIASERPVRPSNPSSKPGPLRAEVAPLITVLDQQS